MIANSRFLSEREKYADAAFARMALDYLPIDDAPTDSDRPAYFLHKPWPKQQAFLDLTCQEAFYGGAAAGGKSDAILMAALQYVHVPGYSALILRRDFPRLAMAGAIMDRARAWLYGTAAGWNEQKKHFRFPSGATIQFGYIDSPKDRFRYQSSEFQFIGWDEATEFDLPDDENNPYLFLFNRLRKTVDMQVPLRVRLAGNPGNVGHKYIKARFVDVAGEPGIDGVRWINEDRAFIPATIKDNPAVNEAEYRKSLMHLPPVTRERLMEGDWSVIEGALIDASWFARYEANGDALWVLDEHGKRSRMVDARMCRRFATIDTAGSSKQKENERKGKHASYSAIAIWDTKGPDLFLRHVAKGRWEWPVLKVTAINLLREWKVNKTHIENQTVGGALVQELQSAQLNAEPLNCVLPNMAATQESAKLDRAVAAGLFERLEKRGLFLPLNATWLKDYESELTTWRGAADEQSDQIDVTSYACYLSRISSKPSWGVIK